MKKRSSLKYIFTVLIIFSVVGGVLLFARRKSDLLPKGVGEPSTELTSPTSLPTSTPSLQGGALQKLKATGFFLEVTSPQDGQTVSSNKIQVKGKTVPGSEVWVNENQAFADKNGNFSVAVSLEEGENYLLVSAGNENGEAEVERVVYYEK